jgi:hypothetical protein
MSSKPIQRSHTGSAVMADEAWLRQRLTDHGALEHIADLKHQVREVTAGVTTTAERSARLRQVILKHNLEAVITGKRQGKTETYAETFERVYGEKLITDEMREAATQLRRRNA